MLVRLATTLATLAVAANAQQELVLSQLMGSALRALSREPSDGSNVEAAIYCDPRIQYCDETTLRRGGEREEAETEVSPDGNRLLEDDSDDEESDDEESDDE